MGRSGDCPRAEYSWTCTGPLVWRDRAARSEERYAWGDWDGGRGRMWIRGSRDESIAGSTPRFLSVDGELDNHLSA